MKPGGIPGRITEEARARWPEWRATFAWIVHSWLRPPDADARWEQESERAMHHC